MTKTLSKKAYAKINLFLDVKSRRPDGYHDIESVMQTVSLHDTVSVTRHDNATGKDISVTCTEPTVPTDKRNIVWKCAERFFEHFGIDSYDIEIAIEKQIMAQAGLAGGSTDGAATLHLLNELYETGTGTETLCEIGVKVGADLPFCIVGGTCKVEGIGEILTPLTIAYPSYHIAVAYPKNGVSTAEAYGKIDSLTDRVPRTSDSVIEALKNGEIPTDMHNLFEAVVLPENKEAAMIKSKLYGCGAISAMMSGSGPSIFGLFDSGEACNRAIAELSASGIEAFACSVKK